MTRPTPHDNIGDPEKLMLRWLMKYLQVQSKYDTKIRTALIHSAEDAYNEIISLSQTDTFSSAVRTAQIRLMMAQIQEVLKSVFGEILPVIKDGQKESAQQAVTAFSETDLNYLHKAFAETSKRSGINVDRFVAGQKQQAANQVAQAISNVEGRKDYSLSSRVYRSRTVANTWVRRQVTSGILRGSSAKQIAFSVRSSIRPNTVGGVSYAAMRLGRTEINNAFHATSINLAQDRPWVQGMLWHLSKVHVHEQLATPEICETLAGNIYEVNNVPPKPHPQCRCYVTPQLESFDVFLTHLTAGQYRDWIDNAA